MTRRWDRRVAIGSLVVDRGGPWRAPPPLPRARRRRRALPADALPRPVPPPSRFDDALRDRALDDVAVIALAPRTAPALTGAPCAVFVDTRLARLAPLTGLAAIAVASAGATLVLGGLAAGFALARLGPSLAVRADDHWITVTRRPDQHEARIPRDDLVDVWSRPGQIFLRARDGRGIALVQGRAPGRRDRRLARALAIRLGVPFTDDAGELPVARALFAPPAE
ncbi:MAG: hypothetical protein K8W52_20070 [Deltaproteobacteria bacterium]|nr:hypothetical protein [Deltaproteobacteria bacterium]